MTINTVMKYFMYTVMRNNMTLGFWDSGYIDYFKSSLTNCTWNFLKCFETSGPVRVSVSIIYHCFSTVKFISGSLSSSV